MSGTVVSSFNPKPLSEIDLNKIQSAVRDIPDFPKPGILFKDITPVLADPKLFQDVIDYFYHQVKDKNVDYIAGIESRGFIFGAPLANRLNAGFLPIRKKGKLPDETYSQEYALEYGTDTIEIHKNDIHPGAKVVLIDDLLATGGTAAAAVELLKKAGADIESVLFMIELDFLQGKTRLPQDIDTHSMIHY